MVRIKDQLKSVRGTYTEIDADIQLQPDVEISSTRQEGIVAEAENASVAYQKIIKVQSPSQLIISNTTPSCNICSRSFKSKHNNSSLAKSDIFDNKNPLRLLFKCDVCSRFCCCETDLEDHAYRHDPASDDFKCPEYYGCSLSFKTFRGFLSHTGLCHVDKPFEFRCPEPGCDFCFITTDRLKQHLAKHLPIHINNQTIRTAKKIRSRYGKAQVKVESKTLKKKRRRQKKKQELLLSVLVPISWECEIEMQVKHYNATLSA